MNNAMTWYIVPGYVSIVYLKIYVESVLAMTGATESRVDTKLMTLPISSRPTILVRCDLVPIDAMFTIEEMGIAT